jgi:drug/metabolite transporter (DMT)-like permease
MWTWYPVVNARHLREHPHVDPAAWVTAQGLATLPLALAGYAIFGAVGKDGFDFPLGPRPAVFVGLMLLVGITASWLANVLWNMASKRLPTSLAGQLIVFETLFALLYAFSLRQEWPGGAVAAGIAFLLFGVWLGMRAFRQP